MATTALAATPGNDELANAQVLAGSLIAASGSSVDASSEAGGDCVRAMASPGASCGRDGDPPEAYADAVESGRATLSAIGSIAARNRQLNAALYRIAVTQLRCPGPGQAYVAKRLAAGDTKTEAIRALRRRLSDEVFRRLEADEAARASIGDMTRAAA